MIFKLFLACLLIFSTFCRADPPTNYQLIFNDEFGGNKLDENKWNYELEPRELAINCKESIKVENGFLKIHTFTKNGKYYTGIIDTKNKFEFNSGYVEIRAEFGDVNGTWSDCWLWRESAGIDEPNPLKNGLEIDIFEHRFTDSKNKNISGFVNHTIHWNGYGKSHKVTAIDTGDLKLNKDFHVFGLIWDENGYTFLTDGRITAKFDNVKTDAKLFVILSTEIARLPFWVQAPDPIINADTLTVDYVRIFKKF